MVLNYAGYDVTKNTLANQVATVPLTYSSGLKGDPNDGFVGDMANGPGPGVYHRPIYQVAKIFKLLINSGNTFSSQIRHFVSRIGFRQLIDRSMVDTETRAIRHIPDKSVIRIAL